MKQIMLPKYIPTWRGAKQKTYSSSKRIFLLFLLSVSWLCSARDLKKDTIYVDSYMAPVAKSKACYYIIKEKEKKHHNQLTWVQNVYYLSGKLHSTCPVVLHTNGYSTHPMKNGLYKEFYPNGVVKREAHYKNGNRNGEYVEYYDNGYPKMKGKVDALNKIYVYNMYDTLGNDQLVKGNGFVCAYDSVWNSLNYYEIIDSVKSLSYFIDSLTYDTVYTSMDTRLQLRSGNAGFAESIRVSDLPYDKVKNYFGQKLYVICVVDENGKIVQIKNKNSIKPEIDRIILHKVKNSADFNPPKLRSGKKVKAAVIMPLVI